MTGTDYEEKINGLKHLQHIGLGGSETYDSAVDRIFQDLREEYGHADARRVCEDLGQGNFGFAKNTLEHLERSENRSKKRRAAL